MKVALILTGLMRSWEMAYPSFKKYIIDRYDTDVYIHTWSELGFYSGKGYLSERNGFVDVASNDRGFSNNGELVDFNKLYNAYTPNRLIVEDFNKYEASFRYRAMTFQNAFTRPKNTVAQAYKAFQGVTQNLENEPHYDLIVRARPDIVLENNPGEWTPDKIYTLPSRNKNGRGTGDSFLVGSPKIVQEIYISQWCMLEKFYMDSGVSCPHQFLEQTIDFLTYRPLWQEMQVGAHVVHSKSGIPYEESI